MGPISEFDRILASRPLRSNLNSLIQNDKKTTSVNLYKRKYIIFTFDSVPAIVSMSYTDFLCYKTLLIITTMVFF